MIVLLALIGLLSAAWPLSQLGSEFMPELEEGDVLYMPTTLPGLSPAEAQLVREGFYGLGWNSDSAAQILAPLGQDPVLLAKTLGVAPFLAQKLAQLVSPNSWSRCLYLDWFCSSSKHY